MENKKAEKWMIKRMQKSVAMDISSKDLPYEKALEILEKHEYFSDWTIYEMNNRPIDLDEIEEACLMEIGLLEQEIFNPYLTF